MEPTALNTFMTAVESALREAVGREHPAPETFNMISTILSMLPRKPIVKRPQVHKQHAACRVMEQAFNHFDTEIAPEYQSFQQLGRSIIELEPSCAWQQNPNYTADNQSEAFIQGQAYQAYLGPEGLTDSQNLAIFSMLMTPDVLYKEHSHPAEELYFVLSGQADWQSGDQVWQTLGPGSLIHHPCDIIHATKTTTAPMLCLAFWIGNLEQRATVI